MKYLAVLGASDPEMEAIENLLRECGVTVAYATHGGRGRTDSGPVVVDPLRVHPGNAYRADVPSELSEQWDDVIAVECEWRGMSVDVVRADHHRHGDYGYGLPPSEFLRASSLGQVITWLASLCLAHRRITHEANVFFVPKHDALRHLGWDTVDGGSHFDGDDDDGYSVGPWSGEVAEAIANSPHAIQQFPDGRYGVLVASAGHELGGCFSWVVIPHDLVLIAAADHCLAAAYRGECPGVDPDALLAYRVHSRAVYQHRVDSERDAVKGDVTHYESLIRERIERAREELKTARKEVLAHTPGEHCGDNRLCGCREGGYGYGGWTSVGTGDCYCDCDGCRIGDYYVVARDMRRDTPIDELVEAATRDSIAYIAGPFAAPDGRRKITCSGSAEVIHAFLNVWAPQNNIIDTYGDPVRGFAGGYQK